MPDSKQKISQGRLYPAALVIARRETLETLMRKTKLPQSWLRKFRQGEIKCPSVQRVEVILTSFGKRLEIWG